MPTRVSEERSLAYHRAIAERLGSGQADLGNARTRVRGWLAQGSVHPFYAEAWSALLERPLEEVCALLIEQSERAASLRHVSPFAGYLEPRERWRLWQSVRTGTDR